MKKIKIILLACLSLCFVSLHATVRLPHVFSDHMVLQRDKNIKIWGWADKNEWVKIRFSNQTQKVKADKQGNWMVSLPPLSFGGPYTMEVEGQKNKLSLKDIYIGDVWLCSGQSNMEMPVHGWSSVYNYEEEIKNAKHPLIRAFNVSKEIDTKAKNNLEGTWSICSPESVANYSAVAYFFARKLNQALNIPIGIINSSWGGTEIESWIPADAYQNLPNSFKEKYKEINISDFTQFVKENEIKKQKYESALNNDPGMKEKWYETSLDLSSWEKMQIPQTWEKRLGDVDGIVWFRTTVTLSPKDISEKASLQLGPIDDADVVWINGVKIGETQGYAANRFYEIPSGVLKTGENSIAVKVTDYSGGGGIYGNADHLYLKTAQNSYPLAGEWFYKASVINKAYGYVTVSPNMHYSLLYNTMIHPLTQLPIKGVIWYQGESNARCADQYQTLFPTLIKAWRTKWNTEFPFYWVQLANYMAKKQEPQESEWARLREAQSMTLSLPQTGQAVITDIGDADDIHPRNKQEVGMRLALIALHKTYGMKNLVCSGPVFKAMKISKNKIYLEYDSIEKGLLVKNKYGYIEGFAVAGTDRKFEWAQAYLEGNQVIVFSNRVPHPVAIRYCWADNPDVNLFNKEGLPAVPFRTDHWEDKGE